MVPGNRMKKIERMKALREQIHEQILLWLRGDEEAGKKRWELLAELREVEKEDDGEE